jgi:hypothetical protein
MTNSKTIKISFVVPDSVIRKSSGIPREWKSMIYGLGVSADSLPPELQDLLGAFPDDKDSMIDLIEYLIDNPSLITEDNEKIIEPLCQMFTINYSIYADGITDYNFEKIHNRIRYDKGFKDSAPVYLNHSPDFSKIFLYTYDTDILANDDAPTVTPIAIDTFIDVKDSITIPFESGKSYALVLPQILDSTLTMSEAFSSDGKSSFEEYFWTEFTDGDNNSVYLTPFFSGDNKLKFYGLSKSGKGDSVSVFWIKANDNRYGVMGWPRATSVREVILKSK